MDHGEARVLVREDEGDEERIITAWREGRVVVVEEVTSGPATRAVFGMGRHAHRVIVDGDALVRYLGETGRGATAAGGLEAFFRAHPALVDLEDGLDWAQVPYTYASEGQLATEYRSRGTAEPV